jgi:ureidoglycolate dehydrogenase (NAD+)
MTLFRADDLKAYASELLQGGGYTAAHAERTADILVWANARGANSHGVLRIPRYVEMVEQGLIDPVAEPQIVTEDGAIGVIEAGRAPGPSAMVRAMDTAIDIASRFNIGWCSARNITHAGAVGYFALRAAQRGYIGIVMTASGPLMAYHGARVSGLSTNPISISVPAGGMPLLLDMSTSTVALGKIMHAKDAGTAIPKGWVINADGAPTTDPAQVSTLTPLGGPKGSGLSLMIEVLSSVLVANPVIAALSGAFDSTESMHCGATPVDPNLSTRTHDSIISSRGNLGTGLTECEYCTAASWWTPPMGRSVLFGQRLGDRAVHARPPVLPHGECRQVVSRRSSRS